MKKLWYHHDISALSGSTSISSIWVIFAISKWSIHLSSFGKTSVHLVGISLTPRLCCSAAEPFSAKYRIGSLLRVLPLYLWKSEGSKGWIGMLARLGIKCHLLRIWALSGLSWALSLVFSALSLLGLVLVCRVFYIRSKFWTDYAWVPSAFLRRSRFCFFVRSPTLSRSLSCVLVSTRVFCFLFGHIPLHEPARYWFLSTLLAFVQFLCWVCIPGVVCFATSSAICVIFVATLHSRNFVSQIDFVSQIAVVILIRGRWYASEGYGCVVVGVSLMFIMGTCWPLGGGALCWFVEDSSVCFHWPYGLPYQ